MPELPEVETVRLTLAQWLIHRTIVNVECFYSPMMKPSIAQFNKLTLKAKLTAISRRGKHLIFELNNDFVILSHLRMEGKYFLITEKEILPKYSIAVFHLDDGHKLVYADTRKFGTLQLINKKNLLTQSPLTKLGIEPRDLNNQSSIKDQIRNRKKGIKSILLDQSIIAGIGNIYADEILFRSRIHPETPGYLLKDEALTVLLQEAKQVIEEAVKAGGTTIRTYRSPSGIDGLFQHHLLAYGREGLPCSRCNIPLVKIQSHGRGTTFCRHCQHQTSLPWIVGLTGEIASGKSTLLQLASVQGIQTISSDEIVKSLYRKKSIQLKLVKLFGKQAINNHQVNSAFLLTHIAANQDQLLKLESWLHPLVLNTIHRIISKTSHRIVMVEMPLLFKAGFDFVCNDIIGIDITPIKQKERVFKRNPLSAALLLKLNETNTFKANTNKINFMIYNDGSLEKFEHACHQVLNTIIADQSNRIM
jgi:formamidopyrimidine-DNA glycosylase